MTGSLVVYKSMSKFSLAIILINLGSCMFVNKYKLKILQKIAKFRQQS